MRRIERKFVNKEIQKQSVYQINPESKRRRELADFIYSVEKSALFNVFESGKYSRRIERARNVQITLYIDTMYPFANDAN